MPRPWQIVAAGGAISCGERANVLQRPPKDLNFGAFGVGLPDAAIAFLDAKIQKKRRNARKTCYILGNNIAVDPFLTVIRI